MTKISECIITVSTVHCTVPGTGTVAVPLITLKNYICNLEYSTYIRRVMFTGTVGTCRYHTVIGFTGKLFYDFYFLFYVNCRVPVLYGAVWYRTGTVDEILSFLYVTVQYLTRPYNSTVFLLYFLPSWRHSYYFLSSQSTEKYVFTIRYVSELK